jgi:hypothetical protein
MVACVLRPPADAGEAVAGLCRAYAGVLIDAYSVARLMPNSDARSVLLSPPCCTLEVQVYIGRGYFVTESGEGILAFCVQGRAGRLFSAGRSRSLQRRWGPIVGAASYNDVE